MKSRILRYYEMVPIVANIMLDNPVIEDNDKDGYSIKDKTHGHTVFNCYGEGICISLSLPKGDQFTFAIRPEKLKEIKSKTGLIVDEILVTNTDNEDEEAGRIEITFIHPQTDEEGVMFFGSKEDAEEYLAKRELEK